MKEGNGGIRSNLKCREYRCDEAEWRGKQGRDEGRTVT